MLKHERIPFVSYPYEWPFSMLKEAALLQLDLNLAALEEDMILKDSSPYNVQFKGSKPVFVDVGSFERLREGEPWIGYRQFCMLYLYPLLLQSVKNVRYNALLRGDIDGISPPQMRGMVSFRDRFRKGFYLNVFLHAKLEASHGDRGKEVKAEVKKAGFKKELIVANVRRMRKLIAGLEWDPPHGSGSPTASATATPTRTRSARTSSSARLRPRSRGASPGTSARTTAATPGSPPRARKNVLAVDYDQGPMELLHRTLREEGDEQILTLTMNLADPTPNLGWRGPGAQGPRRPRQARPRAGAGADPSHRDRGERARPGVRQVAGFARQLARDRVPDARGRDGQDAARPQARGPAPRLRARELRARARGGLRRRAP